MLKYFVVVAALLQAIVGYEVPNKQCNDVKGSPMCPNGHLFKKSFLATPAPCVPPLAGPMCRTTCNIVAKQEWKGKSQCSHNSLFSHTGPQGPSCWHWAYPYCSGSRQSPIDIVTASVKNCWNYLCFHSPLVIEAGPSPSNPIVFVKHFTNNGHAIQADLTDASSRASVVTGGPLGSERYHIKQFHFHFNGHGGGSEHTINGRSYAAEMHLVMYNSRYTCIDVAMEHCNGLAVIGIMLDGAAFNHVQNAHRDTTASTMEKTKIVFRYFSRHLKYCGQKSTSKSPQGFHVSLKNWLPLGFENNYYTYQGSLTTPPCSESVRWIVLKKGLPVSSNELADMNGVMTGSEHHPGHHMAGNRRPVQALNNRIVYSVEGW